jgi:hypothetical protein
MAKAETTVSRGKATKAPAKKRLRTKAKTTKGARSKATKAVADKASVAAKAHRATGRGDRGELSKYQRALRDTAILARVHEGRTSKAIGAEFGVTGRTVENVKRTAREGTPSLDRQPLEIIEWLAMMELRSVGDFERMATFNVEKNPNVALGAKRAAGEARARYLEMMSAVGKLPENLELFRAESVLRRMADEMVETMERVQSGEIDAAAAVAFFHEMLSDPKPRELPETVG